MPKYARNAQCLLTASGEGVLRFPFNRALVNELKASIAYRFRSYDAVTKAWTVLPAYVDLAIAILLDHFSDAEVPRRGQTWERQHQRRPEPWPSGSDPFRVLHLRETAPVELIEGAYCILARLHHPDAGGSTEAMQQLNGAYMALKARVRA
jgi:hypothetical protein